jgi:hypothetical protein
MANNNGVFPELVIDIEPSTTRQGAPALSPIGQTVSNALREVLAWRPNRDDPKAFVAALNHAFTGSEVDGRTEFTWTPRSYAVQADMGAVTGAQASIYARAKAALDQSVPLLQGLFPLRSDFDAGDANASRAVVIGKTTDLVNELGVVGGPRVPRVDDYFYSLLGEATVGNPEAVGGLLGRMGDEFGFHRDQINTVDEEQNFTNYLIVVDNVIGLRRSWEDIRKYFGQRAGEVFLGTQLVQLSRQFAVVAESVQELYFVLDSVFLGAAERETVRLQSGLTIAELFSWVERFCTEEAPRLIREGGKGGVLSFRPTVRRLVDLVDEALQEARARTNNAQGGFHHVRTQAAVAEVKGHLEVVLQLSDQLKSDPLPKVVFAYPNPADGAIVRVTVEGRNFRHNASVSLHPLVAGTQVISGQDVFVVSSNEIKVTFDLSTAQPGSEWTLVVKNPGGASDSLPTKFSVVSVPGSTNGASNGGNDGGSGGGSSGGNGGGHVSVPLIVTDVTLHEEQGNQIETQSTGDSFTVTEQQGLTSVLVTFNREIDETSVRHGATAFAELVDTRDGSGQPVDGEFQVHSNVEVIFKLHGGGAFPQGNYRFRLKGITDAAGNVLANGSEVNFSIRVAPMPVETAAPGRSLR